MLYLKLAFAVVKTALQQLHRHSTGFAAVKTAMLNFYKPSTGFVVIKTGVPNHYKCSTNLAVDQTGLTITYRPSTTFPVVKTGLNWLFSSQRCFPKERNNYTTTSATPPLCKTGYDKRQHFVSQTYSAVVVYKHVFSPSKHPNWKLPVLS